MQTTHARLLLCAIVTKFQNNTKHLLRTSREPLQQSAILTQTQSYLCQALLSAMNPKLPGSAGLTTSTTSPKLTTCIALIRYKRMSCRPRPLQSPASTHYFSFARIISSQTSSECFRVHSGSGNRFYSPPDYPYPHHPRHYRTSKKLDKQKIFVLGNEDNIFNYDDRSPCPSSPVPQIETSPQTFGTPCRHPLLSKKR